MVYGDTHQVYSYVPENAVCKPKGQYAIFKYTGELLVKDWAERYKKSFIICRPSAVYGERDSTDRVVSKFISQAFKNQTLEVRGQREIMDFTHVDDCSEGIAAATLSSHNNLVFNITKSDTKLWTITDAAKIIVEQVGSGSINVVDRDPSFPSRSNLDIRLARKLLSYDPKISLSNGLVRYIDWYKEHLLYTD
jgi:nucleoside-diphosphate-sugar epimerase